MKLARALAASLAASFLLFAPAIFADNKAVAIDEMEAYLDFVDYGATIVPEQILREEWSKLHIHGRLPHGVNVLARSSHRQST